METQIEPAKTEPGYQLHKLTADELLEAAFYFAYKRDATTEELTRSKTFETSEEGWALLLKVEDAPAP